MGRLLLFAGKPKRPVVARKAPARPRTFADVLRILVLGRPRDDNVHDGDGGDDQILAVVKK